MKWLPLILIGLVSALTARGQITNTATMDSADYKVSGKVTVEGYVDAYYSYNFNNPPSGDQPYVVSMSGHNEMNINLAFVDLKYSSSKVRARVAPGFGTYVNANYSNESGSLKNLIEANAGVNLSKRERIWLDFGILGSPYTNESAISKDHLVYTRSLAAENVPYYLSGLKLTVPLTKKVNTYFYLINGWQQIRDQNSDKSFGSQVEYRSNNNILINWNNYIGNESAAIDSVKGLRYFTDLYVLYVKKRISITSCVYYGLQENASNTYKWWQANLISRFDFTSTLSGSVRIEYFSDANGVLVVPITGAEGFNVWGASAGVNLKIDDNFLFRTEARQFWSDDDLYIDNGNPTSTSLTLTASFCAWF